MTIEQLTAAQLARARSVCGGPYNETAVIDRSASRELTEVTRGPTFIRKRIKRGAREALGILVADGLAMQANSNGYSPGVDSVPLPVALGNGSHSGSI